MPNTKAGNVTAYSLIVIGLLLATLASLAVIQGSGITASPAVRVGSQPEPKFDQVAFHAPPYCNSGPFCAGIRAAVTSLNRQIEFIARLQVQFPFLAGALGGVIAILRGIQTRLIGFIPR